MQKSDIVGAVSLMLSLTRPSYIKDLSNLEEETLNAMYREYSANAISTNHMADDLRAARLEVIRLQKELDDLQNRLRIDSRASRPVVRKGRR